MRILEFIKQNCKNVEFHALGDVCEVITGSTPSKSNTEFYGGEIPFYKPADLNNGLYACDSVDKVSQKGFEVSRKLPKNLYLSVV